MIPHYQISPVGYINKENGSFRIEIQKEYVPALSCLDEFSHVQVVWWAHLTDKPENRQMLEAGKLFTKGPSSMGVFATRSPLRPNPVMISIIKVACTDIENGVINTAFIDAEEGSKVLDIKPLYPMDRVKNCKGPRWSDDWPQWQEEVADFEWGTVMNVY